MYRRMDYPEAQIEQIQKSGVLRAGRQQYALDGAGPPIAVSGLSPLHQKVFSPKL